MTEAENWLAYINGEAEYQYREHWHNCVWVRVKSNDLLPLPTTNEWSW